MFTYNQSSPVTTIWGDNEHLDHESIKQLENYIKCLSNLSGGNELMPNNIIIFTKRGMIQDDIAETITVKTLWRFTHRGTAKSRCWFPKLLK